MQKKFYKCFNNNNCSINEDGKIKCKACRFKKCLEEGMSING